MSRLFHKKAVNVLILIMLGGFGLFLLLQSGGPAAENAQRDAAVQLLAPGGQRVVEVQRDITDTSMSAIQAGTSVSAVSFDGDLRDLPQVGPEEKSLGVEFELAGSELLNADNPDPVRQNSFGEVNLIPGTDQNFAGLDLANWGAGWPPDTQGDVGPNHYIQAVNTSIGIYNKTGSQLAAFTFDTLFSGTGTSCDADNNGDPVVLYDNVSGRWIVTDFAWTNIKDGPYYECIAVSKTADPVSGGWWFYALRADDASHPWLNDYPRLGIWGDGIYMTANMFDCLTVNCSSASYKGVRFWALNRDDLINGNPINYQFGDLGAAYFTLMPANAKLNIPAVGTPNYMMALQTSNTMFTWKLSIDWNNPNNSVMSGPLSTNIASYSNISSIPQGGSGVNLDTLSGRLMAQLQYTEVGGTPALWVNHSVSSGGIGGVRWYEFRNLNGTPSVHQQSTYQPDSTHRWMGSLAVDSQGNMAVGYSASSNSIDPQIRYAGRLSTDALNTLGQGEATLIAGTGSQTTYNRWGDYSAMTIDPDGCTFWYTTEYLISTGTNWQTRIGSFSMPGCGVGPTPTPGPTNTPTPTNTPVPPTATPDPGAVMHVGDLDGSSVQNGGRWNATVNITIHDSGENPVANATVNGSWSNGANGSGSCLTDGSGQCQITKNNVKNNQSEVTFTVTSVTHASNSYQAGSNHDPDGDSNGTSINVFKDGPPEPTSTPGPTATPGPSVVMHVGDLDGSSSPSNGNRWNATVTITIHDADHNPIANATVNGSWSNGANGGGSCVTNTSGQCTITKNNVRGNNSSVTFTVDDVTATGNTYNSGANHDPDGDSNGSVIIVLEP